MTEEEKKAIKWLKELYDIEKDFNSSKGKEESNIIKTLLNLIEKQQNLIEECDSGEVITENQMRYIEDNFISKDKIRDKIKEITDKTANIGLFIDKETSIIANAKREVLKELLEEN